MLFLSETMGQSELLTRILAHPFLFIAIILLVKVAIIIGLIWLAAKANSEEFDYEEMAKQNAKAFDYDRLAKAIAREMKETKDV